MARERAVHYIDRLRNVGMVQVNIESV